MSASFKKAAIFRSASSSQIPSASSISSVCPVTLFTFFVSFFPLGRRMYISSAPVRTYSVPRFSRRMPANCVGYTKSISVSKTAIFFHSSMQSHAGRRPVNFRSAAGSRKGSAASCSACLARTAAEDGSMYLFLLEARKLFSVLYTLSREGLAGITI